MRRISPHISTPPRPFRHHASEHLSEHGLRCEFRRLVNGRSLRVNGRSLRLDSYADFVAHVEEIGGLDKLAARPFSPTV